MLWFIVGFLLGLVAGPLAIIALFLRGFEVFSV